MASMPPIRKWVVCIAGFLQDEGTPGGLVAIISGLVAGIPIATSNAFLLKAEIEKNEGGEE